MWTNHSFQNPDYTLSVSYTEYRTVTMNYTDLAFTWLACSAAPHDLVLVKKVWRIQKIKKTLVHLYLKIASVSLYSLFRMDRWKLIAPCFFPCRRISKTWWKHPHVVVQLRRVNIQVFHINILLFALETFWAPMSTRACWRKVKISKQYGGVI